MIFYVILSLALSLVTIQHTEAKSTVSIRFVSYDNPGGKGNNGQCCDGKWKFCQRNGCDHMFTVCLDGPNTDKNINKCIYGKIQSKALRNQDKNTFGRSFGGISNPMKFTISSPLPSYMNLKVDVWDYDSFVTNNDFVDFLRTSLVTQGLAVVNKPAKTYTLKTRTSLVIQVTVQCAADWYGTACGTYCKAKDNVQGHYTCDVTSGRKICKTGWTGKNCDKKSLCRTGNLCRNGGTCQPVGSKIPCLCKPLFEGTFCQRHMCEKSCRPGYCLYMSGPPRCYCPANYRKVFNGKLPKCVPTTPRP